MVDRTNIQLAGSDGNTPIYRPDDPWTIHALHQLWQGPDHPGAGRYVPRVGDWVVDTDKFEFNVVVSIDNEQLIPKLKLLNGIEKRYTDSVTGLLSSGRRTSPDSYRVYLDTSEMPYTLSVDSRFLVGGTMSHHAQIFRGTDISANATPISRVYDANGVFVNTRVPLELVQSQGIENHTLKCVPTCRTDVDMPDGEIVSIVIYDDTGGVVSIQEFFCYNTAAIRTTDVYQRYIRDIVLESPFMSEADPNLLAYPLNVPVHGLNLSLRVIYNDGSSMVYPINGVKASVYGLKDFVSTIIGYEFDFTVTYVLAENEQVITNIPTLPGKQPQYFVNNDTVSNRRVISRHFTGKVVKPDNSYTVKLFGYPYWVDDIVGYRMRWWLFDLDRSQYHEVTSLVSYNNGTRFDGLLYGASQRLSVSIDLNTLHNVTYKKYIHTQVIDVLLERNGSDTAGHRWSINFELSQERAYGIDNWALLKIINQNLKRLNITQNEIKLDKWLERVWLDTKPLYDSSREAAPPRPNMFKILVGTQAFEFPIESWNTELEINAHIKPTDNIDVLFYRRTQDTDLFLGLSSLPVFVVTDYTSTITNVVTGVGGSSAVRDDNYSSDGGSGVINSSVGSSANLSPSVDTGAINPVRTGDNVRGETGDGITTPDTRGTEVGRNENSDTSVSS